MKQKDFMNGFNVFGITLYCGNLSHLIGLVNERVFLIHMSFWWLIEYLLEVIDCIKLMLKVYSHCGKL